MLDGILRQLSQFGYDLDRLQFVAQDEVDLLARSAQDYDRFIAIVTGAVQLARAGQVTEAREVQLSEATPLADRLERLTNQLVNVAEADMLERIEASQRAYDVSRLVVVALRARQHRPGAGPRLRVLVVDRRAAHPDRGAAAPDRGRRVRPSGSMSPTATSWARSPPTSTAPARSWAASTSRSRSGRRSCARRSSGRPRPARCWASSAARPPSCSRCWTRSPPPPRASATRNGRLSAGAKPTADITWQRPAMPTRSSCGTWRRTPSFPGGQP